MHVLKGATTAYILGSIASDDISLNEVQQKLVDALQTHSEMACLQQESDSRLLRELSPVRRNLLDWISFSPDETVLELGGHTGILTQLLCERCRAVESVIASEADAYVNAVRNQAAPDLRIHLRVEAAAFPKEEYDTVVLAGADRTLHRSIFPEQDDMAYDRFLALAYDCLKPQGRLLLAVSNRLGLQYWSGKTDACSPSLFGSILGETGEQEEYCFSKKRLLAMLEMAGFGHAECYYPVPDYYFPAQIFSDRYLPQVGDIRPASAHYDSIRYQLFDEKKAFDTICEDGLFDQFANSFLVVCRKGGGAK